MGVESGGGVIAGGLRPARALAGWIFRSSGSGGGGRGRATKAKRRPRRLTRAAQPMRACSKLMSTALFPMACRLLHPPL